MRADVVDDKYFDLRPDDSLAFVFLMQLTTMAGFAIGARWAIGGWAEALMFSYGAFALAFGTGAFLGLVVRQRAELAFKVNVLASKLELKKSLLSYIVAKAQLGAVVITTIACAGLVWPLMMGGMALHQALTGQSDVNKLDTRAFTANPLYSGAYFALIALAAYAIAVPLQIETAEFKIFLGLNLLALTLHHLRTILGPYSTLDNVRLIYARPRLVFFAALILDLVALVLLLPVVARGLSPHEVGLADLRQSLQSLYFHEDLLTLLSGAFEWKSFVSTSVGLCFDIAVLQLVFAGMRSERSDEDWQTLAMEQVMRCDSAGARASIANVKERTANSMRLEAMVAFSEGIFYEGVAKIIDAQELRKKYSSNTHVAYAQAVGMIAVMELGNELWLRFFGQAEVDNVCDEALAGIANFVISKGVNAKDIIKEKQDDDEIDAFATKYPVTFATVILSAFLFEKEEREAKALVELLQRYGHRYEPKPLTALARIAWPLTIELAILGKLNPVEVADFFSRHRQVIAECCLYLYTYDDAYIGLMFLHRLNSLLKEHGLKKESAEIEASMQRLFPILEFHGGTEEREAMEAVLQLPFEEVRAFVRVDANEISGRRGPQTSPA